MEDNQWEKKVVTPEAVFEKIRPGSTIFLGTGMAEPRTLVKRLMQFRNLDLELIQLASHGDAINVEALKTKNYRLKTFYDGFLAQKLISAGLIDLIPCRYSKIPELFQQKILTLDVAFVQVTLPNASGYCSLGLSVDVAREAMEQASIVVGEITPQVPVTFGDTFVHISEFDFLVRAEQPPVYHSRQEPDEITKRIAWYVASLIDDGSCLRFSPGTFFDALAQHLIHKRHLGIHSAFITDPVMDLIKSGVVTNRKKNYSCGKTLCSYAFGTPELMAWLDANPLIDFQGIDKVFNPLFIGSNPDFVFTATIQTVDLSGRVIFGSSTKVAGEFEANEVMDFFNGAESSAGGLSVFALSSRNEFGKPNICLSVMEGKNVSLMRGSVDMVATEYGLAYLKGKTIRERAQALIDIAHPQDRKTLMEEAKQEKILYADQILLSQNARLFPKGFITEHTFKGGVTIRFRATRPSDEGEMRRLFYRFSDESVVLRYFAPIRSMPHGEMQEYVNYDYNQGVSIVALSGKPGLDHIIAEARFVRDMRRPYADVAFMVDEAFQGLGIGQFMLQKLIRRAKDRGLQGFTADVLATNVPMIKVFEKCGLAMNAKLEQGVYRLHMPFTSISTSPKARNGD